MKFLLLATLFSSAFGAALFDRDIATIKAAMSAAGDDIVALDNAGKAYAGDAAPVIAAADKLIQTLKDGKAKVDPSSALSLTDALGLQEPAGDLQKKGDALLATLKSKKDVIQSNGFCEKTFTAASDINTASKALIDSVVSKVPTAAQGIAQNIVAGLLKALQEAQDTFSPANCKNTGTGPSSAAPSSAAPTSAAPTSAPPTSAAPTSAAPTSAPPTTAAPTSAAPTTTAGPGTDTCPAGETVTVTETDSSHCCTKKPPVTVTTTKKSCPTKAAKLF